MTNRDIDAAWKYHNATRHSYSSIRSDPHSLDWANKPLEYKIYPTLEVTRLPDEAYSTGVSALSALSPQKFSKAAEITPGLETLAQILFLSAGITKAKKYPGGEIFFRAAACTGALYEIELYIVSGDLLNLPAGLYHFGVAEFGLRQLRAGDFRRKLANFAGKEVSLLHAPVSIVCTATYWRNAWKYQARTYRHFGWDNGTILANMLAVSSALGLPATVVAGFVDESLNEFLGLDTQREVTFSLVSLGHLRTQAPKSKIAITALQLPVSHSPGREIDYPLMREMHAASSLASADEVTTWRGSSKPLVAAAAEGKLIFLPRLADQQLPHASIEEVILRRGSTRHFARVPLKISELSVLLEKAGDAISADFLPSAAAHLNELYVIINDVEAVPPGSYFYHRNQHALELLREGNFRNTAGYLALEQALAADASVCVFLLADLNTILHRLGNRGYRATQLEAGIIGGKLYLAAYAQALGATGLTFYDDDVVRFFSPHAQGKSAIFLVALGRSRMARTTGPNPRQE